MSDGGVVHSSHQLSQLHVILPADLLFAKKLSIIEKVLYGLILTLHETSEDLPSNRELAELLGISRPVIITAFKKLEEHDLIKIERKTGGKNTMAGSLVLGLVPSGSRLGSKEGGWSRFFTGPKYSGKESLRVQSTGSKVSQNEKSFGINSDPAPDLEKGGGQDSLRVQSTGQDPAYKGHAGAGAYMEEKVLEASSVSSKQFRYYYTVSNDRTGIRGDAEYLLEFWNDLPQTTAHRNKSTKVYKESILMIETFIRPDKDLMFPEVDPEWANRVGVPVERRMVMGVATMMETLRHLAKIYEPGWWPKDKKRLPKTLPDFFFNPRTRRSMFLHIAFHGARTLFQNGEEKKREELDPKIMKHVDKIREAFGQARGDYLPRQGELETIMILVADMAKRATVWVDNHGELEHHLGFPSLDGLIEKFCEWLVAEKWEGKWKRELDPRWFYVGKKMWDQFELWLSHYLNYSLTRGEYLDDG